MQVLRARLYELETGKRRAETAQLEANKSTYLSLADQELRTRALSW